MQALLGCCATGPVRLASKGLPRPLNPKRRSDAESLPPCCPCIRSRSHTRCLRLLEAVTRLQTLLSRSSWPSQLGNLLSLLLTVSMGGDNRAKLYDAVGQIWLEFYGGHVHVGESTLVQPSNRAGLLVAFARPYTPCSASTLSECDLKVQAFAIVLYHHRSRQCRTNSSPRQQQQSLPHPCHVHPQPGGRVTHSS
jgi:hypothetical protein